MTDNGVVASCDDTFDSTGGRVFSFESLSNALYVIEVVGVLLYCPTASEPIECEYCVIAGTAVDSVGDGVDVVAAAVLTGKTFDDEDDAVWIRYDVSDEG